MRVAPCEANVGAVPARGRAGGRGGGQGEEDRERGGWAEGSPQTALRL